MGSDRLMPGEVVLDEIIVQGMVSVEDDEGDPVIFTWSCNTTDQLDAAVRNHIHSCSHPKEERRFVGGAHLWCGQCGAVKGIFSKDWVKPKIV